MSDLSLRGLAKSYGIHSVVHGIDLEVEGGQFLSLLGPSGCGKTTTLQMIAGFVDPTAGTVSVGGKDLRGVSPEKRDMGVVFQSYALFPHMKVAQNVGFGLEMRRVKGPERQARIEEALAMVRLSGMENRYPSQLSGGQRQRVAIARALAIRPRILLLDEPMSNLDSKLRGEMHVELRALQRRLGITTVLVTHDQVEAMTMSDRIAVMSHGRIAQVGSPQEVYEKPATEFAPTFLSYTNIIEGTLAARTGETGSVQVGPATLTVPVTAEKVGEAVRLSVRPERLRLCAAPAGIVGGRIATRLFLGGLWVHEVETELGLLRVTSPNSREVQPGEGDAVGLAWAEGDVRTIAPAPSHG